MRRNARPIKLHIPLNRFPDPGRPETQKTKIDDVFHWLSAKFNGPPGFPAASRFPPPTTEKTASKSHAKMRRAWLL